jgi:ABC-type multidrug transport system fused ATPase/permease subunit
VVFIDESPFIFTGTIRENIDPFKRFTDEQVCGAMTRAGLW